MFFRLTVTLALLPSFLLAQQFELVDSGRGVLSLNDFVINASSINGSVIVNGDTSNSNITITGSDIQGDITFDNGCAIAGDTVYECDGSQRQMNGNEKKKMAKRRAQLLKKHNQMRRKDVVEVVEGDAESKLEVVDRKRKFNKNNKNNKNHGKNYSKKKFKDTAAFSPCKSCHNQQNDQQNNPQRSKHNNPSRSRQHNWHRI